MHTGGASLRFAADIFSGGGEGPVRTFGRPARPLFATPGIPPDRSRRQGYTLVIQRASRTLAVMGRALVLVLKEKADVVVSNGAIFRSERLHLDAPSVVRLRHFVKVPYRPHAPL